MLWKRFISESLMDHRFCCVGEDLFPELIFLLLCPPTLWEEDQKTNIVEKVPMDIGN